MRRDIPSRSIFCASSCENCPPSIFLMRPAIYSSIHQNLLSIVLISSLPTTENSAAVNNSTAIWSSFKVPNRTASRARTVTVANLTRRSSTYTP